MRLALLVASLLVLTGCAAEPTETAAPSAQVSEQAEDNSSMDVEAESEEQELSKESKPEDSQDSQDSEGSEDSDEERSDEDEAEPESDEEFETGSESNSEVESEEEAEPETQETESPEPEQDAEPSQEPAPEPEPSPTAEEAPQGYTLAQVAERDSSAECWVAIDGGVYDLTEWIRSHPGGSGAILNLCGTDGTASFTSRHGGQSSPTNTLNGYYLAPLVS